MIKRFSVVVVSILISQLSLANTKTVTLSKEQSQQVHRLYQMHQQRMNQQQVMQERADKIRNLRHLREQLAQTHAELSSKSFFKAKASSDLHKYKGELEAKIRKFEQELTKSP